MPFAFITAFDALLLHHQLNPISQKKTKRLNIQIQRKPDITKEPESN
jgi:hypothetical protein